MDKKLWEKILHENKLNLFEANLKIDENTHRILLLALSFYKKKGNKNDISDNEINFVIDELRKMKSF